MPMYYAVIDAGTCEDGDENLYDLAIEAPDKDTALAVVVAYGADKDDRITDIEDPDFWNLIGIWDNEADVSTPEAVNQKPNWTRLIAGAEPGEFTYAAQKTS